VSAGFDAAKGDNLGKMLVTPEGYAHMTHMLAALAGGKLVLALEVRRPPTILFFLRFLYSRFSMQGGYNVNSVAESANACVQVIVGDELPFMSPLQAASSSATNTVHEVKTVQRQFWRSMGEPVPSSEGT
jgi:histone deacetylase 6